MAIRPLVKDFSCTLPFPPSMNTYWRSWQGHVVLSARGRAYRKAVQQLGLEKLMLDGSLTLNMVVCPPDKRVRDLDNLLKAPLDALKHAGVIADDRYIDSMMITRSQCVKQGRLFVHVYQFAN